MLWRKRTRYYNLQCQRTKAILAYHGSRALGCWPSISKYARFVACHGLEDFAHHSPQVVYQASDHCAYGTLYDELPPLHNDISVCSHSLSTRSHSERSAKEQWYALIIHVSAAYSTSRATGMLNGPKGELQVSDRRKSGVPKLTQTQERILSFDTS